MAKPQIASDKKTQFHRVSRETVSELVVQQIVGLISEKALKPGQRLPSERDLCAALSVGRTSVREALKSLQAMGVLESRNNTGSFVAAGGVFLERAFNLGLGLNGQNVNDIIETREMLETNAAYWAAKRATPQNISNLRSLLKEMGHARNEIEAFRELDVRFHLEIADATQNIILISMVQTMRQHLISWLQKRLSADMKGRERLVEVSLEQHNTIFDFIRRGDGEPARKAMAFHIQTASADLRKRLQMAE